MNVRCPSCRTVFRVDPAKVPEAGVRARCAVCAATIDVRRDGQLHPAAGVGVAPPAAAPPRPAPAPPPHRTPPPEPAPRGPRLSQPFIGPRATPPPAAEPLRRPSAPVFRPTPGQPVTAAPPVPPPAPPAAPAPPKPAPAPVQAAAPTPAVPVAPAPTPPSPGAAPAARPVNPFLQKDPKQKARRLARALVSDMIVYQPAKRQRALAEGTLKETFDEEIQKSWEEYVEQVGEEMAESTPYWREALNDILAGGQQVF